MAVESRAPLPPVDLRAGGRHFSSDEGYVSGGVRDVQRLQELAGLDEDSTVLDWGCGSGRLATGLKTAGVAVRSYLGVDVKRDVIAWANEHLRDDVFRFIRVGTHNDRYNPSGAGRCWLPAATASSSVVYAYSVISHLLDDDTSEYLREIARVLTPGGRAWVTAFVEDDVPDVTENPEGYGPIPWMGSLHCVRYDRAFFEQMVVDAGLRIVHFEHGTETDGQSLLVLGRAGGGSAERTA